MKVTVFGATGVIGRALLPVLAEQHEVVAVSRRSPEDLGGVRWAIADAADDSAVARAVTGAEAVLYLVHSLGSRDFEQRDRLAARTVARASERAGVGQLVFLGGLGEESGAALSPHLRSRAETERELGAAGVPLTTLRAGMVVGAGSAAFETIVALVERLPAMVTPRWVSTRTQPIALGDVVRYLAGVCGLEGTADRRFDVGGPEVMTYREMIERIGSLRGRSPRIVEVPVLTPRLSSLWLHLVTPVKASVARPLIEGLRTPTVVRDDSIRKLLPFELTGFDEAARLALAERDRSPSRSGRRRGGIVRRIR